MPPVIRKPHSALIVVGHGSTVNPDSSAPTRAHAEAIRREGRFAEVRVAFLKEKPSLAEALSSIESGEIYVVPNFISEGYFTQRVIPRALKLDGPITVRDGKTLKYCKPVGNHPQMTEALLRRAANVAPGVPPSECSLVIAAHGTGRDPHSASAAKHQAEAISALGKFGEVSAAYMEEPPLIADWLAFTTQPNVVVVPFFIADGLHSFQDIPVLLGIRSDQGPVASECAVPPAFRENPHRIHGRALYYASAIGTEPYFKEVILDQVTDFDAAFGNEL